MISTQRSVALVGKRATQKAMDGRARIVERSLDADERLESAGSAGGLANQTGDEPMLEPLDGPAADTLDLHGMTWSQAEPAVVAFVNRNMKRQRGTLLHVITGKGRGSPGHPVLKTRVRTLLRNGALPVEAWGPDLEGGGFLIRLRG